MWLNKALEENVMGENDPWRAQRARHGFSLYSPGYGLVDSNTYFAYYSATKPLGLFNFGMSRSLYKGPYVDEKLQKKVSGKKPNQTGVIKTWARASMISPDALFSIRFTRE